MKSPKEMTDDELRGAWDSLMWNDCQQGLSEKGDENLRAVEAEMDVRNAAEEMAANGE